MSDSTETKAEKFVRLKDARLGKVMDALRILKNTTNVRDYDYTEDQALEVLEALQAGIDDLSESFGIEPAPREVVEASAPIAPPAVQEVDQGAWNDPSNLDPEGVQSNLKEVDGKPLKVKPGEWDGLMLLRVGPHLGLAMEAVIDGDNEKALELLKKVMTA